MDILDEAFEQGTGLGKTITKQVVQAGNQAVHLAWDQLLGTNTASDNQSPDTEQLATKKKKQINRLRYQRDLEVEVENLRRRKQQSRLAELQQESQGKQVKKLQEIEVKKKQWEMSQADKASQGTAESRVLVG